MINAKGDTMSIPKKIHYCWFGRGKKSELMEKCIASWSVYCPDWEIIEWNEDNFDVNFCPYAEKAYKAKKYAYLTDVARLKIIYEQGGIYFDTDVELLRPIDALLNHEAWFGYMRSTNPDGKTYTEINTGSGFGSVSGNAFVKILLDQYLSFGYEQPFQICNRLDTAVFAKEWPGFRVNEAVRQEFAEMVVIDDIWQYTFHHCTNSWLPWYKKVKNRVTNQTKKLLRK